MKLQCRSSRSDGWDESDHKDSVMGESHTLSLECVHEEERRYGLWGHFRITCMLGRGRGRVPAHDLRSSSRARLSISNCLSCSRTEASREAVLAHCSIHTLRVERTGQGRINTTEPSPSTRTHSRDRTDEAEPNTLIRNSPPGLEERSR